MLATFWVLNPLRSIVSSDEHPLNNDPISLTLVVSHVSIPITVFRPFASAKKPSIFLVSVKLALTASIFLIAVLWKNAYGTSFPNVTFLIETVVKFGVFTNTFLPFCFIFDKFHSSSLTVWRDVHPLNISSIFVNLPVPSLERFNSVNPVLLENIFAIFSTLIVSKLLKSILVVLLFANIFLMDTTGLELIVEQSPDSTGAVEFLSVKTTPHPSELISTHCVPSNSCLYLYVYWPSTNSLPTFKSPSYLQVFNSKYSPLGRILPSLVSTQFSVYLIIFFLPSTTAVTIISSFSISVSKSSSSNSSILIGSLTPIPVSSRLNQ